MLLVLPLDLDGRLAHLRLAVLGVGLMAFSGCGTIWIKSELLGTPPIPRPMVTVVEGVITARDVRQADGIVRLVIATQLRIDAYGAPGRGQATHGAPALFRDGAVRVNLPLQRDNPLLTAGARIRLTARLMPPAPPMVPGAFDLRAQPGFRA